MGRREAYIASEPSNVSYGWDYTTNTHQVYLTQRITEGLHAIVGRDVTLQMSIEQAEDIRNQLDAFIRLAKETKDETTTS